MKINKKKIILVTALLSSFLILNQDKGEASSLGDVSIDSSSKTILIENNNTNQKTTKDENMTVNVYRRVMKDYTDNEIDNFFAIRGVDDDTRIIADKGGGFFSSLDGKEGVTSVLSTSDGDVVMDLSNHNQSATVGQIKEALKEEN